MPDDSEETPQSTIVATTANINVSNLDLSETMQNIQTLVDLLEESEEVTLPERKSGRFVNKNVFVIGERDLTNDEIPVLSKGSGFCPTPDKINKYELKQDFQELSRIMR